MRPNSLSGSMLPRSGYQSANKERRRAKEKRISNRKDQQERLALLHDIQPFGIYRPLEKESYDSVVAATLEAVHESANYLQTARKLRNDIGRIVINGDLGMTFMGYQAMRHGLEDAVKNCSVNPEQLIDDLEQIATPEIRVPISHFEWGGNGRRRLLARFSLDSMARQELDDQRRQVDAVFSKHDIRRRPVEPDHVSLVRYGKYGDKQDLNSHHRRKVAGQFEKVFQEKDILDVVLGGMNIGSSYSRPLANDLNVIVRFSNEIED